MNRVFLYTTPLPYESKSPFWREFFSVARYTPNACVVLVGGKEQKQAVISLLSGHLPGTGLLPEVMTLDELLVKTSAPLTNLTNFDKTLLHILLSDDKTPFDDVPHISRTALSGPGFLNHLLQFVTLCRQYQTPEKAFLAFDRYPYAQTLIKVKRLFMAKKQGLPFSDLFFLYEAVRQEKGKVIQDYVQGKSVFVYGFKTILPYQQAAFRAALCGAESASVHLLYDPDHSLYSTITPLYAWLKRQVKPKEIPVSGKLHSPAQGSLFDQSPPSVSLRLIRNESPEDEIRTAAKLIRRLCRENPSLSPGDITIVYADHKSYAALCERLFPQYGIPFKTEKKESLLGLPVVAFIQGFIELSLSQFGQREVLSFVHLPLVRELRLVTGEITPIRSEVFFQIAAHYGIKRGMTRWLDGFDRMVEELKHVLQTDTLEPETRLNTEKQLNDVMLQKEVFKEIAAMVETIRNSHSAAYGIRHLKGVFQLFNISDAILSVVNENTSHSKDNALLTYTSVMHLLDRFERFYQAVLAQRKASFQLEKFLLHLKVAFSETEIEAPDQALSAVKILSRQQSFLATSDMVIVLGLNEGKWPGIHRDNIFCPKEFSEALRWPDAQSAAVTDKLLLLSILYRAQKEVFLFYADSDGETPLLLSHLIDDVRDEFGLPLPVERLGLAEEACLNEAALLTGIKLACLAENEKIPAMPAESVARVWRSYWAPRLSASWLPENRQCNITAADSLSRLGKRYTAYSFSPSALETYQTCPHHYFFKYVLNERPLATITDDISATLWGTLVHEIMSEFTDVCQRDAISPADEAAEKEMERIAQEKLKGTSTGHLYWDVKNELLFDREKGLISAYLKEERTNGLPLWPGPSEYHFKDFSIEASAEKGTNSDGTLTLTGKIDLILFNEAHGLSAVLDYKTGKSLPTKADVEAFRHLQLPVYQLVVKRLFPEKTISAGIIYQVHNHHHFGKQVMNLRKELKNTLIETGKQRPTELNDEYFKRLENHLLQLKRLIVSGIFHYTLTTDFSHITDSFRKAACTFCPYTGVCRYPKRFG